MSPSEDQILDRPRELPDRPMSTVITRAHDAGGDPDVLAIVAAFPDGTKVQAVMRVKQVGYLPPDESCQKFAASLLDGLLKRGNVRMADATNWPSVAAACQRIVFAWNRDRRDRSGGAVIQ